jgi:Zn-dependent oligopeptidase
MRKFAHMDGNANRDSVRETVYRRAVLERGGTIDAHLMVRDLLGRDPSNEAFLRGTRLTGQQCGRYPTFRTPG